MLYTHADLHVPPGGDAGFALGPWAPAAAEPSLDRAAFRRDGWATIRGACAEDLVAAARDYVAARRADWALPRLRPDDWRCHLGQPLAAGAVVADGHAPLLALLRASPALARALGDLGGGREPAGLLYTQVAHRTPLKKKRGRADARPGHLYHIDGEANASGSRFPDLFSVILAVALSPQLEPDAGNLSVFPREHARDWRDYPDLKRTRSLPDLGRPLQVSLDVGDAVLMHPLLPHRGGTNCSDATRELVFFRVQYAHVAYDRPDRGAALLADPFVELDFG